MAESADGPVQVTRIRPDSWPDLTARDVKKYRDEQIRYVNFAGNKTFAARARQFAQAAVSRFHAQSAEWSETCRWKDWLFRANTLRRSTNADVHVPEILKSHRAFVPRVVDAFYGTGRRFFKAQGRDSTDRTRSAAITSMLEYQLELNKFRSLLIGFSDSLLKYDIACFKTLWEEKTENRIYHWTERETDAKGSPIEVHYRQRKDVAYWVGNKIRLANPQRMVLDLSRWDDCEMGWIGDERHEPLHEVLKATHRYKNLEELRERKERGENLAENPIRPDTSARTGLRNETTGLEGNLRHGTQWVKLLELWGYLNFAPDRQPADMRRAIITLADDDLVLEVRENFHDDKHHPYSFARTSENGFEFIGVGLYDPALRVQDEYDHMRATAQEAFDMSVGSRVFAEGPGTDLPNTLYDLPPGAILKNCGKVSFQAPPHNLNVVPMMDAILRRDIEEIIGVPRIWQGAEGGPTSDTTATEINRKIGEGNRRLLSIVGAVEIAAESLLQKMHSNNGQFIVDKYKFRVLDKKNAKLLGTDQYEMSPSELLGPVDFTFFGPTRLQSYGLRGTNLLTFLQTMSPIIQTYPELFDLTALSRQVYQSVVGEEAEDEVMRSAMSVDDVEDQTSENRRLRMGLFVTIHELDDDLKHLTEMEQQGLFVFARKPSTAAPVRRAIYDHAQRHLRSAEKKLAQAQAMKQQQQRRAMLQPQQNEMPGAKQPVPAGGLERGARQTNGSGTGQQVGRAGRQGAISQSNNGEAA